MRSRCMLVVVAVMGWSAAQASAQQSPGAAAEPAVDVRPVLRVEAGGPANFVSALAFNPQGNTLYEGGWDKVVRVWSFSPQARGFVLDPQATYRVPVGPGLQGAINAVAVSPDGLWLAVAAQGVIRGTSDLWHNGWRVPIESVMTAEMRKDEGTIYLFNTRTRDVKLLRGHTAPAFALAFAPPRVNKPAMLVSAGRERAAGAQGFSGAVRAWNVERAQQIGSVALPDVAGLRPSVAAWHTGPGPLQLRVAIAWGDANHMLRVWDIEKQTLPETVDGISGNVTTAWWPDGERLITGSDGRLALWNVTAMPRLERSLRMDGDSPRAIALFSSIDGGRADRAAVIVRSARNAPTRLLVVDLASFQLLSRSQVPLWQGAPIAPSLAAAPGAAHLAVAGNANHEIKIVPVRGLLAGNPETTSLRGDSLGVRRAGFVRKQNALGLHFSQHPKAGPGPTELSLQQADLIFDPSARRISNQFDGWLPSPRSLDGWQVELPDEPGQSPFQLVVRGDEGLARKVALRAGYQLSDYALSPPRPLRGSILAVASHLSGQPLLEIYDVQSGAVVRELTGHTAKIESLAFSDDGKLLVSVANDQTVCLWDASDLDEVIGARATLVGITLEAKGPAVVVSGAGPGADANLLAVGDVLLDWSHGERTESF
ncbi:MAG TPA: WD40 repeat domain-containing protein, partial [Pirellulales bacterium]|nr:WD40 repeat domain-containing protein [Pirellulales bacterium]